MYIQYLYHIHPPKCFLHILHFPLLTTFQTESVLPSFFFQMLVLFSYFLNLIIFTFNHFYTYSHICTLFGPRSPLYFPGISPDPQPTSRQNLFYPSPPCSPILLRRNTGDIKKDIVFSPVWDKDSYTERFLALLPCIHVLQPTLVHLYQISSLIPSPLHLVASANLRLLYLLLCEDINHIHVLNFLPFPCSPMHVIPLVCDT
jgi:hypothetical protein